jgi:hypothetical protein
MRRNSDDEGLADLLDPDARPLIADDVKILDEEETSKKLVKKVDMFTDNKWVKINLCEDEDGDFFVSKDGEDAANPSSGRNMFRKRGGKTSFETQVVVLLIRIFVFAREIQTGS